VAGERFGEVHAIVMAACALNAPCFASDVYGAVGLDDAAASAALADLVAAAYVVSEGTLLRPNRWFGE